MQQQKYEGVTLPHPEGFRAYVVERRSGRLVRAGVDAYADKADAKTEAQRLAQLVESGELPANKPERLS